MRNCRLAALSLLILAGINGDTFSAEDPEYDVNACLDQDESCTVWAEAGECENNPHYMMQFCRLSCQQCVAADM